MESPLSPFAALDSLLRASPELYRLQLLVPGPAQSANLQILNLLSDLLHERSLVLLNIHSCGKVHTAIFELDCDVKVGDAIDVNRVVLEFDHLQIDDFLLDFWPVVNGELDSQVF